MTGAHRETLGRFPARPLADLPIALLEDSRDELIKSWVAELVKDSELDKIDELPFANISRHAPRLLDLLLQGLASDRIELDAQGWVATLPEPIFALDLLRSVIFANAFANIANPEALQVAQLTERLNYLFATLQRANLASAAPEPVVQDLRLDARIKRSTESGEPFCLAVLEIADFELLDTESQKEAIEWLEEVARTIASRSGEIDTIRISHRVWLVTEREVDAELLEGVLSLPSLAAPLNHGVSLALQIGRADYSANVGEMIEAAEECLLAARAQGLTFSGSHP